MVTAVKEEKEIMKPSLKLDHGRRYSRIDVVN